MNASTDSSSDTACPFNQSSKKGVQPSKKIVGLAIAYTAFFLVTLWAAYNNRLPLAWLSQFPHYDKVGHVVLYCIPTYLGHRLWRLRHISILSRQLPLFPLLFTLFTLAEELVQGFSPYRTLDVGDMVCSLFGILLGYGLAQRVQSQS